MTPESEALRNLLARVETDGSVVDTSYAHNYLFETRVSTGRQAAYEAAVGADAADVKAWKNRHKAYIFERVYVKPHEVPETFVSSDSPALLGAIAAAQYVVRLESLGQTLAAKGYDLARVEEQLDALRSARKEDERRKAHAFLSEFCDHWNRVRGQHRPSFATFLDEIEADLPVPDWPDRVRDRLGLSHHNVTDARPAIPVALVRYRAGEVLERAGEARSRAFAVPTVLDGELNSPSFRRRRLQGTAARLACNPIPTATGL